MYEGSERRKVPRANGSFVISYRVIEEAENVDITQTKNIGLGGMLLTTNREFPVGTRLDLEIRLPLDPEPIRLVARVVESKKVVTNLIYDTRLAFLSVDDKHQNVIGKTVDYYLKRKKREVIDE